MSWIFYALMSAFSAALVAIFGKIGISNIDNTLATTIRAFIMFLFLGGISLFLGVFNNYKQIDSKALTFIVLSGIAGATSWLFYFYALKKGPVAGVASIDRLSVVFVIILSILFLNQTLNAKVIIGAILLTAGAILLAI